MELLNTTLIHLLSKVTSGEVIIDSYMKNDMSILYEKLMTYGISEEEITLLISKINEVEPSNTYFSDSENIIADMYMKKVNYDLTNGLIDSSELDDKISEFDSLVVHSREELVGLSNDKKLWNMDISFNKDIYKVNDNVIVEEEAIKKVA